MWSVSKPQVLLLLPAFALAVKWEATIPEQSFAETRHLIRREGAQSSSTLVEMEYSLDCSGAEPSRPGTPKVEAFQITRSNMNKTLAALGDRILKAADGATSVRSCGSFFSFGDFTWCDKAMPAESDFAQDNSYNGTICKVKGPQSALEQEESYKQVDGSVASTRETNNGQIEGLSYGIGESDPWSEMMSSMYYLMTRLFDCNTPKAGPMVTDMHDGHERDKPCQDPKCYTTGYQKEKICLGTDQSTDAQGRRYLALSDAIHNRPPISAHAKIDVDGGVEWPVLEQLLASPDDIKRLRSLDLTVNLSAVGSVSLERRVQLLEELGQKFAVTGSTIQPVFESAHADFHKKRAKDDKYEAPGSSIYTSSGLPLDKFAISYVNRDLM